MGAALITGICGQDGSYLAEILLAKGYQVVGTYRKNSHNKLVNISHIINNVKLLQGDVTDPSFLMQALNSQKFDFVFHEADQDQIAASFNSVNYQMEVTIKAVTSLLEIIRQMPDERPKVFLPSSATIFGNTSGYIDEDTPLNPQSPYAIGKAAVLHLGNLYRNVHGLKITTGILCNHDSDRRNGSYLLHDIARIAVECSLGRRENTGLRFSNVEHEVSIGEAPKFMEIVHRLISEGHHDNYVIGSSSSSTIENWINLAFHLLELDYRDYLVKAAQPNRPGKPETLLPSTSKLEAHLSCRSISTDQYPLMDSLITKYKKELT